VNEPYELLEKLGAGGMGQVYRARDTRLNRVVAVKALKADLVCTPEQRRRFLQEAQAASALNHPNIVTIHDMVSENGRELMVMEYVSGNSLREMIPPGGMPVDQILHYGVQLADALTAAHGAGIIHRDLKPGNIMVTERGLVKILDFGLAKLPAELICEDSETRASTAPLTVEGTLLGTVAYMSPEQAEGRPVDTRSDIFSLGSVFYEMATGQRAFDRGNTISTLTAVLRDEPRPIVEVAPDVSPDLQEIILRCLRKNPDERWQDAVDIYRALLALKHSSDSGSLLQSRLGLRLPPQASSPSPAGSSVSTQVTVPKNHRKLWMGLAWLVTGLLAAAALFFAVRSNPQPPPSPQTSSGQPTIRHNEDVLKMLAAHVPESAIMADLRNSQTSFDLAPAQLVRLTQAGASEKLLEQMRNEAALKPADAKPSPLPSSPGAPPTQPNQPSPAAQPAPNAGSQPNPANPAVPPPVAATPLKPGAKPSATSVTVPDGTPLRLSLAEDLPDDVPEGSTIHFTLDTDLVEGGVAVLPAGAKATGTVVEGRKKKVFGWSKISYRLDSVQSVDGKQVRIRAASIAGSPNSTKHPLELPGAKAKDLAAQKGAHFPAYIDGDVSINGR
jgi:serine/threonine protein kinase